MSHKLSTGLNHCNEPVGQKGAGLPIALFIVTVLSLIVLGMSQLQESSGNAISLQIQSQRAFFAAESGAQVAIAELLKEMEDSSDDELECSFDSLPINYSADGLSGCEAEVQCGITDSLATLTSTGTCGFGREQAVRKVEVLLR